MLAAQYGLRLKTYQPKKLHISYCGSLYIYIKLHVKSVSQVCYNWDTQIGVRLLHRSMFVSHTGLGRRTGAENAGGESFTQNFAKKRQNFKCENQ